MAADHAKMVDY